ncbi:MAG TPA: SLBB domain-containing protein [Verrucomicrobiota bacterium]|nr:SLBB domain-containing protein [Verrucomicrobiota bacterium]
MKCISVPVRQVAAVCTVLLLLALAGCAGPDSAPPPSFAIPPSGGPSGTNHVSDPQQLSSDILRPGDRIRIVYNDIPDAPTPTEQVIPEDGKILLPRGIEVTVGGKKRTDVEKEIMTIYVDEKRIYRKITVTIERMASFISVEGEVRTPSSIVYRADLNVLSAVAAAGGFTEFAKRSGVIVTRAATKKQEKVNATRAVRDPKLNVPLYPGDSVYVPRGIW